ncbi:hypothetical protein [Sphingobium subterraneum]|uniref:Uncharacterized protein n=1 Tax=Sphingobium subterraneum TaxID=627688 RepID=A0A841J0Y4_9SPHN|nr:hypothetical protein [Sphingobium subterraneum]MBB6124593.1 hypothetical protein [Sphingobium subterraneum]
MILLVFVAAIVWFVFLGRFVLRAKSGSSSSQPQIYRGASRQKRSKDRLALIEELAAQYELDELFVSRQDGSAVGMNFDTRQVLLGKIDAMRVLPFSKIMAVEVLSNGVSISKTNRGSQLAGAAVGGLVLGGLGALAGGLTGSRRSRERLGAISLKVAVNDREDPYSQISLFSAGAKGLDAQSPHGQSTMALAERWRAHLINAMEEQDESGSPADTSTNASYAVDIVEASHDFVAASEVLRTMMGGMEAAKVIRSELPKRIATTLDRKEACCLKAKISYGGFRCRIVEL